MCGSERNSERLYGNDSARIKIKYLMEPLTDNKGLRQQHCSSPTLFKKYVNEVLKIASMRRRQCGGVGGSHEQKHTLYPFLGR